ncbi:MAG TPA: maleylpyruvate isomerase family mycothiol-dependent enzyme [Nocardioidaceae bacterium]|nr:maleylpyruvate isomerase family mycothiol-dependent enzyme [Nocardioidaceae bacterium]
MSEGLLEKHIETWRQVVAENVALLGELAESDWDLPTDLPGWNVRYVAAHMAHLESDLAGNPQTQVEVPEAPHIVGLMGQYTESGALARAGWATDQIIQEFESSAAQRYDKLQAMMPLDPTAGADGFAGLIGWTWATLLSNRPVDQWMHQQDIRRATGRSGGLDSVGARHVLGVFSKSLPYVLGKKARAAAGQSVVVDVTGPNATTLAAAVGDGGRGALLPEAPADPTARIALDFEAFIILSGGRRDASQVEYKLDGDEALGRAILDNMAVTP